MVPQVACVRLEAIVRREQRPPSRAPWGRIENHKEPDQLKTAKLVIQGEDMLFKSGCLY